MTRQNAPSPIHRILLQLHVNFTPFSDPERNTSRCYDSGGQHPTKFFAKKKSGAILFRVHVPRFSLQEAFLPTNFPEIFAGKDDRQSFLLLLSSFVGLSSGELCSLSRRRCVRFIPDDSPLGDHQRQGHEGEGGGWNERRSRAGRDGAARRRSSQDSRLHRPVDTWEGGHPAVSLESSQQTLRFRGLKRAKMTLRGCQRETRETSGTAVIMAEFRYKGRPIRAITCQARGGQVCGY